MATSKTKKSTMAEAVNECRDEAARAPEPKLSKTIAGASDEAQAAYHAAVVADVSCSVSALSPMVSTLFRQLSSVSSRWNVHQGFWTSDNFGEKIALCHSELSEALEAHRKDLPSDKIPGYTGVAEELADLMIRVFDVAGYYGIPLGEALVAKFQHNLSRPYKHGKKY